MQLISTQHFTSLHLFDSSNPTSLVDLPIPSSGVSQYTTVIKIINSQYSLVRIAEYSAYEAALNDGLIVLSDWIDVSPDVSQVTAQTIVVDSTVRSDMQQYSVQMAGQLPPGVTFSTGIELVVDVYDAGSAGSDWSNQEKAQIRQALGVTGATAAPSVTGDLQVARRTAFLSLMKDFGITSKADLQAYADLLDR